MTYGHQIWLEEPLTIVKHNAGVKGHIEVMQGQPEVKLLGNTLSPNQIWSEKPLTRVENRAGVIVHRGHVRLTRSHIT